MGGAEMFTSNKCAYLKSRGWNVRVFYFNKGNKILIDNLKEFSNNYVPELKYGYYYWSSKQRKRILNFICKGLHQNEEIVVESHLMGLTYWGELIAQYIGAKSILNCLEENIRQITPSEADFIEYKVKRHEVLNGSPKAFQRYFGELYKPDYDKYTNVMVPMCTNVVSDDVELDIDIEVADFNLLSIGRLDKLYVQTMLIGIKHFIKMNNNYSFNLLIIGGSPGGRIEKQIQDMFKGMNNVNIYLFGYMFPIPAQLIRIADVAMASANSILVSADQGVPTISYDMTDYQTMGIYGYTTNNKFKRDNEPALPTEFLLEDILLRKKYNKTSGIVGNSEKIENVFASQEDYLVKYPVDYNVYDVMSIHSLRERIFANLKRFVFMAIGRFEHNVI